MRLYPAATLAVAAALCLAAPRGSASTEAWTDRMPAGGRIVAEAVDGERLDVYLDLPAGFLRPDDGADPGAARLDEAFLEALSAGLLEARRGEGAEVTGVLPWAVDPVRPDDGWLPLPAFLPPIAPPPVRAGELPWRAASEPPPVSVGVDAPGGGGFLSGKVVYVSQAHGFVWTPVLGRFATQRGNTNGVVEDLVNAEAIDHYLVAYLRNAGATVFTVREHDLQEAMIVVDAEPGGEASTEGGGAYEEGGAWADSVTAGFRAGEGPYEGATNPHALGGNRVVQAVAGEPTAWARWTPDIPAEGAYTVYVSYSQDASRVKDAHYAVRHLGGETHVRVNQERHGWTWIELGTFRFGAGQGAEQGSVTLTNDSDLEPGDWLSADAVRFGGGVGDVSRGDGAGVANGPTSNRARWEECSRYYAQFSGAPASVWDYSSEDQKDDVSTRSRYAAWQNEAGEDAVYISWHTNAPDPGRGTSTYVYGPNPPDGSYTFTGTAGSDDLASAVHGELIGDIRAAFDPSWKDRGLRTAYFGEVNPSHNPEMPAALVEAAFHDTAADAAYLIEPRFRAVVARAFYQGVAKYFAARDGVTVQLSPDPPERLRLRGTGPGQVTVAWAAPPVDADDLGGHAATGYRVYRSLDGRAFDDGLAVAGGATTSVVLDGVEPGAPLFVRVTATNAGGESFPTVTLPVLVGCEGAPAETLLVHGFYRLDAASMPTEDLSPWGLGTLKRFRQREMNRFDHLVEHGWAFAAADVAFDSAEAPAIEAEDVALAGWRVIDWQLGEESTADETFSVAEQALVADWLGAGGARALLVSGAELGWDLEAKGDAGDTAFLHGWLGAGYVSDDAVTSEVAPAAGALGGALADLGTQAFDDGSGPAYAVDYPDVFVPLEGAETWLEYANGAGAAGIRWSSPDGFTTWVMGFPLETLLDAGARAAIASVIAEAEGVAGSAACGAVTPDPGPEPMPEPGPEPMPEPGPEPVADVAEPAPDTATPPEDTGPLPEVTLDVTALPDTAGPAPGPPRASVLAASSSLRTEEAGGGCRGGQAGAPWLAAWLVGLALVVRRRRGVIPGRERAPTA